MKNHTQTTKLILQILIIMFAYVVFDPNYKVQYNMQFDKFSNVLTMFFAGSTILSLSISMLVNTKTKLKAVCIIICSMKSFEDYNKCIEVTRKLLHKY